MSLICRDIDKSDYVNYYLNMTAKINIANTNMLNQINLLGCFYVDSKIHYHIVTSRDISSN